MVGRRKPSHGETAEAWDVVARAKYRGEFEDHVALLRAGRHSLLEPEANILGPLLPGSHVVQLQCSHGLDALGLLNAGASSVMGVDISEEMIAQAKAKAEAVGTDSAFFMCSDVTDLPSNFDGTADLVYTGRGSLPWISRLSGWAKSVARLLKPHGHLFIFEGHPLASLWDRKAEGLQLRSNVSYFNTEPVENPGFPASVVQQELGADRPRMLERHWPPGEVMDALIAASLDIRLFREFPVLFWDQFPHWPEELRGRLPNSYAILAQRGTDQEIESA